MAFKTVEIATVIVLILVAAFLVSAARRHILAARAMERYLAEFSKLCEDDTINITILENMQDVFKISCKACASVTILVVMLQYKWSPDYRKAVDSRHAAPVRDITPRTAKQLLLTYEALFDYACYAVPICGGLIRFIIRRVRVRVENAKKPGVFGGRKTGAFPI